MLDHFDIEYQSLQGLSDMIKRRTIADAMTEKETPAQPQETAEKAS